MNPIITPLHYTYKKEDSDVWVLNTKDIPVPQANIKDQQIVHLAPHSVGGNHRHPRVEWFVGIGDLEFIWLDEHDQQKTVLMHPDGQIFLIEVPPFLPHAVRNNSQNKSGVLFEFANDTMKDVEKIQVV